MTMNKSLGCFLGSAIGDALGTTNEFKERDSYPHLTDFVGGGAFRLHPGEWTDDTSMALALMQSLLDYPEFDPQNLLQNFVDWMDSGRFSHNNRCFDIGNTTMVALTKFSTTGQIYPKELNHWQAGNGSLMRLAPVPILYKNQPAKLVQVAELQSLTTHASHEASLACQFYSQVLANAINGKPREKLMDDVLWDFSHRHSYLKATFEPIIQKHWFNKTRSQISSSGYVIDTLEAALWCFYQTDNFHDCVLLAANLGDDSDTVAAVAGQLAGAFWGLENIPQHWIDNLAWSELIQQQVVDLEKSSQQFVKDL